MRKIILETGIRNIKDLSKRYKKAKIYFHMDLDGVTTAIAMKEYLNKNGIDVVDSELIQYGDKEWSIKKPEGSGDIMPVLVDFAHGKPMFVIHTDHHDRQAGVEKETSTNFRPSRSNVETISQIISPKELFGSDDISLISTVDSANFAANDISIDEVLAYAFKLDKSEKLRKNKFLLGLVTNKLLLAFKNKPGFLEKLVMECTPSILNIYLKIREIMKKEGFSDIPELEKNRDEYIKKMSTNKDVKIIGNIIKK
jgi:hypothetical protein